MKFKYVNRVRLAGHIMDALAIGTPLEGAVGKSINDAYRLGVVDGALEIVNFLASVGLVDSEAATAAIEKDADEMLASMVPDDISGIA